MSWEIVLSWIIAIGSAIVATAVVAVAAEIAARSLRRRWRVVWRPWRQLRRPVIATLLAVSLRVAIANGVSADSRGRDLVVHIVEICLIAATLWLIAALVLALIRTSSRRILRHKQDDRDRRRTQTQLRLLDRLVMAAFWVIGVALILMTFPGMDRIGTGILASAGFLSIVAGLAAQSSLANLFAGIQLAFSDAIRIDDVVVVQNEWGHIEDITLTYVVVRIWDDRRLVLPSTYFTTTPFTNWTRTGSMITGTVYFELDWRVDIKGMRERLEELLAGSPLWDGRSSSLVVYDATGSVLTVRVVVSAIDSGDLWTLRCLVREELARWVRENNPEGLPHQRVLLDDPTPPRPA